MNKLWARVRGHFQEYVNRYAVLAIAVLTPAAALLGALAANLGGVDTSTGRAVLGAASAVTAAAAGLTWLKNSAVWQMLDRFGPAPQKVADVPAALDKLWEVAEPQGVPETGPTINDVAMVPDVDTSPLIASDGMPTTVPTGPPIDEDESLPDGDVA
jgi:hypothetical protein